MGAYEILLQDVLENGVTKGDRTGTGTISVFGRQIRFDLSEGFPLITTKRVPFRLVAEELLWFLSGSDNVKPLLERNVHIWTEWAFVDYLKMTQQEVPITNSPEWKERMAQFELDILEDKDDFAMHYGSLGRIYGVQWRTWRTADGTVVDQIDELIKEIKRNPNSRRLIVSAWNAGELDQMSLTPCHAMFQFYVADGKLSCQLFQRSADMFLGVPFNIASYALLTHMIAQQCDLEVGEFIWTGGDTHIYLNHLEQVHEQLSREDRPLPKLVLKGKPDSIFDYTMENFEVMGYYPHDAIKAEISV